MTQKALVQLFLKFVVHATSLNLHAASLLNWSLCCVPLLLLLSLNRSKELGQFRFSWQGETLSSNLTVGGLMKRGFQPELDYLEFFHPALEYSPDGWWCVAPVIGWTCDDTHSGLLVCVVPAAAPFLSSSPLFVFKVFIPHVHYECVDVEVYRCCDGTCLISFLCWFVCCCAYECACMVCCVNRNSCGIRLCLLFCHVCVCSIKCWNTYLYMM